MCSNSCTGHRVAQYPAGLGLAPAAETSRLQHYTACGWNHWKHRHQSVTELATGGRTTQAAWRRCISAAAQPGARDCYKHTARPHTCAVRPLLLGRQAPHACQVPLRILAQHRSVVHVGLAQLLVEPGRERGQRGVFPSRKHLHGAWLKCGLRGVSLCIAWGVRRTWGWA